MSTDKLQELVVDESGFSNFTACADDRHLHIYTFEHYIKIPFSVPSPFPIDRPIDPNDVLDFLRLPVGRTERACCRNNTVKDVFSVRRSNYKKICIHGCGTLARWLKEHLERCSMSTCHGSSASRLAGCEIYVKCDDRPDLSSYKNFDKKVGAAPWFGCFVCGDRIVTTPIFNAKGSPALKTFLSFYEMCFPHHKKMSELISADSSHDEQVLPYFDLIKKVFAHSLTHKFRLKHVNQWTVSSRKEVCHASVTNKEAMFAALSLFDDGRIPRGPASFGPILKYHVSSPYKGLDGYHLAYAAALRLDTCGPYKDSGIMGCGSGFSKHEATIRAVYEGIERAALIALPGSVRKKPAKKIKQSDYFNFDNHDPLFARQRRIFNRYSKWSINKSIHWIKAHHFNSNSMSFLPAFCLYPWWGRVHLNENFYHYTSTGTAIHASLKDARLKALLEIIERDAVMIRWYGKMPAPEIELECIFSKDVHRCREIIMRDGYRVCFNLLSLDIPVPVVSCTLIRQGNKRSDAPKPFITFASAAALSMDDAIEGAFREALQVNVLQRRLMKKPPKTPIEINTLVDHASFYASSDQRDYFEWWCSDTARSETIKGDSSFSNFQTIARSLMKKNALNIYEHQLYYPYKCQDPFYITRLFVPELVPLNVEHAAIPLRHSRLRNYINVDTDNIDTYIKDTLPHPVA